MDASTILPVFVYVFAVTDAAFSIVAAQGAHSSALQDGAPVVDVARPQSVCSAELTNCSTAVGNWYNLAVPLTWGAPSQGTLWVDGVAPADGTRLQVYWTVYTVPRAFQFECGDGLNTRPSPRDTSFASTAPVPLTLDLTAAGCRVDVFVDGTVCMVFRGVVAVTCTVPGTCLQCPGGTLQDTAVCASIRSHPCDGVRAMRGHGQGVQAHLDTLSRTPLAPLGW